MQYFLGLHEFTQEALFDASMMVHFRKRFPVEEVAKINEYSSTAVCLCQGTGYASPTAALTAPATCAVW